MPSPNQGKNGKNIILIASICLVIELLDELVDGLFSAAYPSIRNDLNLDYVQIGMLHTIPNTISSCIEPILGIWGDIGQRRRLIIGGGVVFAMAIFLISLSDRFSLLLVAFVLFYPASGCFVNLSQATLMDIQPTRHEQNMARLAFVGSLGNVIGPLLLTLTAVLGQNWRSAFLILGILTVGILAILQKNAIAIPNATMPIDAPMDAFQIGVKKAIAAVKQHQVFTWLTLLQFSDLMLDIFRVFLGLYLVDTVGTSPGQAGFAIAVWLGFGLLGDFLLIPLLERIQGLVYLRLSAIFVLLIYPAFLLIPNINAKLIFLALLGLTNAGWYSILQGKLYSAMPGQSGTVMALNNLFGLVGGCMPLILSFIAENYGLQSMMWLLMAAPITLLLGLQNLR